MEAPPIISCVGCKKPLTSFSYRGEDGWRCDHCAPPNRPCKNKLQGCTFTDLADKCIKHQWFFCEQSTKCVMCMKDVLRGSLSKHYVISHQDVMFRAGATWKATRTDCFGRCCLVVGAAGTAVCRYWLNDSRFDLQVHTPVSSERLSGFRCVVHLTVPAAVHKRTFTPDVEYNQNYDWRILVKKDEFQFWNSELGIVIEIKET